MGLSLNRLYLILGISKQAFHQWVNREVLEQSYHHQLLFLVYEIRADHPTMRSRDMYYLFKPEFIGRDGFQLFCKRLFTEQTTLITLNMAARCRKGVALNGTILHSDGGG